MSFYGAVFVVDDTVQEGQENVVTMVPEPVTDDPILSALYKIRAVVVALEDVSETVNGTKIASALIDLGPELNHWNITISKSRNVGGFSIGVALPNADGSECRMLAKNILEFLRYRFGKLTSHDVRSNIENIRRCLQQFISLLSAEARFRPNINSILFESLVAGIRPSLAAAKRLSSIFSSLEVAEVSNDAAFTLIPRHSFPIGSCFFRNGLCVHTNMIVSDLLDAALFCLVNNVLSRTKHDGSLVFCRQVFSPAFEQRMLSIVTAGESAVCMLFHCTHCDSIDGHVDPFCITEMKSLIFNMDIELLCRIDDDIARIAKLTASCCDLPLKLISRHVSKKRVPQTAIVSPKPKSAPSSPKIRRRSLENTLQQHKEIVAKGLTIAGNGNCILQFRIIDVLNKFVTESPILSQDSFDIQIADAFRRAIPVIKRRLTLRLFGDQDTKNKLERSEMIKPIIEIKNKQEINDATSRQRFENFGEHVARTDILESAFHFRIKSVFEDGRDNAFQELGFVVIGKLIPPHHEVYLCVEDTIPQNTVDLSFQLLFAWA